MVVFDGFPCATVSDLNTFSTAEAEVWLPLTRCVQYFQSSSAADIHLALQQPLPISGERVEAKVVERFVHFAEEMHMHVVVVGPKHLDNGWPCVLAEGSKSPRTLSSNCAAGLIVCYCITFCCACEHMCMHMHVVDYNRSQKHKHI